MKSLKKCLFVVMFILSGGLTVLAQDSAVNLLPNVEFSALDDKGGPQGWNAAPLNISIDQAVKPAGCAQSLKVSVLEDNKNILGYVQQKVKVKPQTNYTFSCQIKASPGTGILMIKLLGGANGNSDIGRLSSTKNAGYEWETLKISFYTESAETVLVMLRYTQTAGQTLWFAMPKLVEENKSKDDATVK